MTSYYDLIDHRRTAEVLGDLVRIPSVNPGFPNGNGEEGVAAYLERFYQRIGLNIAVQPVEPRRNNVIGTLPGTGIRHLLLEAHMDTVQTCGMSIDPFGAVIKQGRLYGRGACDTKASLAAMLIAVETMAVHELKPPVHVHLAGVVDEEITYKGISALADRIRKGQLHYDAAIVGEPTQLNVIIAHKGVIRFHIDVHGTAAHSSTPYQGVNAIEGMAEVISYLKHLSQTEFPAKKHPMTGEPTLCFSMISGGIAPNTVAGFCRISVDRRLVPGEEGADVLHTLRDRLKILEHRLHGIRIEVHEPFLTDYAMEVSPSDPFVHSLTDAANRFADNRVAIGAPYCSDASKLTRVGVPTVVFGPGDIAQAHTNDEWVELDQVTRAAAIIIHTAMHFERA